MAGAVKSKRILLIRNAYQFDFGGAERFPINLGLELANYGYEVTIVSRSQKLLATARQAGLPVVKSWWWSRQNWSGRRVLISPIYLIWQLALFIWYLQLLIRLRPYLIHLQSKDDFVAGTFAGKLLRKKVIWTDHADLKYVFANHRAWYKNPVGKLVYLASLLADNITLVSNDEKLSIEKMFGRHLGPKYQVIHNGVPELKPRPLKLDGRGLKFCTTSRLVSAKGIAELIAAFEQVLKHYPDAHLVLVGDGPEEANFKSQAAKIQNINFAGYSDKALGYVAAADVFVHPSYHEGLSLSVVEAAMLAKPIIACDVGGTPEIIENNVSGLLIPPRDSTALAAAMGKLASDSKLRDRLGQAARQTYEQNFRLSNIVKEKLIPLYEED